MLENNVDLPNKHLVNKDTSARMESDSMHFTSLVSKKQFLFTQSYDSLLLTARSGSYTLIYAASLLN